MVTTRRSAAEKSGVALRAAAAQRQRSTTGGRSRSRPASSQDAGLPAVYGEMLAEAGVVPTHSTIEPPRKRLKRPGERAGSKEDDDDNDNQNDDEDEDVEFEDIAIPLPVIQTAEMDSDDSDDSDDLERDEADVEAAVTRTATTTTGSPEAPQSLELNLTAHESALAQLLPRRSKTAAGRRKPLSRAERIGRLDVHKMHVMCLLAHASRRNRWCNRAAVQAALRPLLSAKTVTYLNPGGHLSQFGRTESLKNGLQQAAAVFRARFVVTERGMRRALWAEDASQLRDIQPPADGETVLDEDDFVQAARSLRGSRDVGAQLFCALLRAVGVETRLVCSLQPLSFVAGAPTMPRQQKTPKRPTRPPIPEIYQSPPSPQQQQQQDPFVSPLRRLGHPQAAAYNIPFMPPPRTPPRTTTTTTTPTAVVLGESAFPVYWVEVLDVAHQKWQPVDPLVTGTQWKPARLEPPASDRSNQLTYVIGFAVDRSAKDVTRRYAKAYNAKTRRARVDGPAASTLPLSASSSPALTGPRWLRRVLRHYRRPYETDVDTIEDTELSAMEAREPMPRNVADFQNHPVYALARHLHRHQVLLPGATAVGTVSAGSKAPSERIYRRRDVRPVYTADRWYRQGRIVLPNEIPAKWLPKRARKRGDDDDDDDDDSRNDKLHPIPAGVPAFTPEQTELYRAPAVVDGRVPKNKFGNVELYVPSMVPPGGEHVADEAAARAAFLLGVDYAPALTGFRFDGGHHGTAVLRGVVVAAEHAHAVRAVLAGLTDQAELAEAERRSRQALRIWAALLRGLRIRERIRAAAQDRGKDVDEDEDEDGEVDQEPDLDASDVTDEYDMVMDDDQGGGGGFLLD
ncbi:DNA repair protein [Grosmannia clavigera kw1407]|uniref:DNA repair protein n=1 Tax=Grosmannia clavigera (strain kw1407 / UAMH 11150) TaxID=655863 RepID=F0X9M3_GROCL|nr:DNA repair protein [Grosmannia clavigera kw1407]EFX05961.1 DNA repair protein [Grosmannia clavigera kw1407]